MIEVVDLIGMELEREVFNPSTGELDLFDEDCEPIRLLENE
jgi:hypothetical protein